MIALIKDKLKDIQDVCKKHHVLSLYLIGSAAKDEQDFTDESDIDFLYRFDKKQIDEMEYADNYFSLLFSLQEMFSRKVDLVPEEKLKNPFFITSINSNKQMLYEA
jgi:predicted nucleotidyltransferase